MQPANRLASVHDGPVAAVRPQRLGFGYFYLGSLLLSGYIAQAWFRIPWPELEALQRTLAFKIGSGALLIAYLWTQWQVPWLRMTGRISVANRRLAEHKLIGVLGPLILYLHSAKLGVGFTWLLSVLFLGNAALSLLNRETLGIKGRGFWLCWLLLHISVAVTVTALGVLHAVNALYYE